MPDVRFHDRSQEGDPPDIESRLEQFETAWGRGTTPSIATFLPSVNDPARRAALEEMIKIDLEYRWSRARRLAVPSDGPRQESGAPLPCRPRLDDYVACFPELGPLQALPVELIGEEYRVRQRWGDRPGHAEYAARFGEHGPLRHLLDAIDRELAAEQPCKKSPPSAGRSRRTWSRAERLPSADREPPAKLLVPSTFEAETPSLPGQAIRAQPMPFWVRAWKWVKRWFVSAV